MVPSRIWRCLYWPPALRPAKTASARASKTLLPADPGRETGEVGVVGNLAQAMTQSKAKAMLVSSYWGYCPIRHLPVREDHPRRGSGKFSKIRQIQEDVLVSAGASVVHLPDIFGPGANYSFVNEC